VGVHNEQGTMVVKTNRDRPRSPKGVYECYGSHAYYKTLGLSANEVVRQRQSPARSLRHFTTW
jgi:hypothetical protein